MVQRFDIIIGGGSFAGLTLARALGLSLGGEYRLAVVEPRSLEPAGAPAQDGRAVALSAAAVHMLSVLGVWPQIATQAQAITAIDISDTALEATVRLPVLTYANRLEGDEPASWVMETAPLQAALLAAVRSTAGVTVLEGSAIDRFTVDDASIQVSLRDERTLAAALLVAADGRDSQLREMAGMQCVRSSHEQIGILTIVAHELPHGGRATQHFLPAGPFAILPLPGVSPKFPAGGRAGVTWTEEATRGAQIMALDDAGFLAELERRFGTELGTIALDAPRHAHALVTQLARRTIARRFALIGDAAHTVHPIGGQGLNLALRDVAALAEAIADAARLGLDIGGGEPLERYERWRRFDSTLSAATMDGLNRLFSNDWVLARALRDAGAGLIDRLPTLKRFLVEQAAGVAGETPKLLQGKLA